MSKTLIAYFSASGETARLAKTLAGVTGGDLFEIKPQAAYTAADLNWNDSSSRSTLEMKDDKSRPAMAGMADVAQYDVVFVGFPIWWYEAPRIIETFLESCEFSGKTLVPFAPPDREMAPRQATRQPGKRRVRPKMGGQSGAMKGE